MHDSRPPRRASPVAHLYAKPPRRVTVHCGMPLAVELDGEDASRAAILGLCDLSALARAGLKGPNAEAWLRAGGVAVPEAPNSWRPLGDGGLIARLARTEFLLEDGVAGSAATDVRARLTSGMAGVYPVHRQDLSFALSGTRAVELFAQTCNVDIASIDAGAGTVVLTSMCGVSVVLLRRDQDGQPSFRLWCDYTSGPYLWETLAGIAGEMDGGPVGAAAVLREFAAP